MAEGLIYHMTPTNLKIFMLGWALATFVKGMKIRLRKNWLSILAKREVPQSRNCLWCDELIINMIDMGCVVYDVVYVIKSVWMSEHALHVVIRRGVWGVARGQFPLSLYVFCFWVFFFFFFFFFFFWGGGGLSAKSRTSDDDNTPTQWRRHGRGGGLCRKLSGR